MDHATCFRLLSATHFATSLLPLTVRLIPVLTEIGRLIVGFRRAELTPQVCHQFETQLHAQLRELGRIIVDGRSTTSSRTTVGTCPIRCISRESGTAAVPKPPTAQLPPSLALSPSGAYLYQPLHGVEPSIFPLEIRLGLEVGLATPALTERVGQAAVTSSQNSVLEYLKRNHGVSWSVATLRKVIAGLSEGMESHRHDASVAQVLKWLEQAYASRGGRKPVLAVGRDGLMLPIRGEACYREGATATVSVHDRKGRRLGTVYLGRMPEPGQETLSRQLTALIEDVLRQWNGPLPRLAYITDGGNHQTQYFRRVLKRMRHPRRPDQRLKWEWVIDYYHACEYIYKLSEALFSDAKRAHGWARKMCRWLKKKPRGIYRVLHSAAAIRRRRMVVGEKRKQYHKAYDYLRKRIRFLDYCEYRRNHLPIGSGVTEAACKTVFTQRLKQSGMTWSLEGGQWIVDLRVVHLSGIWPQVYQAYLQAKNLPEMGTQEGSREKKPRKAA